MYFEFTFDIIRHHANIRKALDYGVKQQFIIRNVADAVQLPKRKEFVGKFYTIDQLRQLQEKLRDHELEMPVNLAIYLGLRREEISGLKWKNVDLNNRKININEDGYVCSMNNCEPYKPERISALFPKFLIANNLPHIRLHDLRHPYVKYTPKNNLGIFSYLHVRL